MCTLSQFSYIILIIPLMSCPLTTLREEEFQRNNAFIWPRHCIRTPAQGDFEIYNFGRLVLGHHYCILNLSASCPSVGKKEEIWHFPL